MENFEEKINNKEMLNNFLNKYFPSETSVKDEAEAETVEIKREELEKIIEGGESVENLLNRIREKGYIFHGSPKDTKEMEARQASDINESSGNILKAVYATNIPEIAIFHAILNLIRKKGEHKTYYAKWESAKDQKGKISVKFSANQSTLNDMVNGYVYVLKEKDFTQKEGNSSQFTKEENCIPTYKIPVKKEDFARKIEIIKDSEVLKII